MKVSKNIPIPKGGASAAIRKYPFNELEVGDSVEFESTEEFEKGRRAAAQYARNHKQRYIARKGIQDGEYVGQGGTIWREK